MDNETVRLALNKFLKLYFDACHEVYEEINFDQITGIRFKYLKEIYKRDQVTITELANHFDISKPTVTEVIKIFEDNGIVKKKRSETDKRVIHIQLTDIGEILASTNKLESERAVLRLQEQLDASEIRTLTQIFNKISGVEQ
ncbi:MAG: MarR family winged helix-turn-helix transcriptional regulator [Candidatus Izimaplasma sp.]|nr:MarR family winged helix-turn-helix transcriptional regulator [Candidatus Izimaplasma bacterium]